jgi:phosphoribosylaminoimidazolecarboxamide formyltransferase/IMP cyclohydrolase
MVEMFLRYGMNPHQAPARAHMDKEPLPFKVINGLPGYINLLDALNSWQLVQELSAITGLPSAASFKHVSPAGAGLGLPLTEELRRAYFVEGLELSPLAAAYARARGADRVSSFGDWVALSETVDVATANLLRREISDGVIAPGFEPRALEILKRKQGGKYRMLLVDPSYEPPQMENRQIFGVNLEQARNSSRMDPDQMGEISTKNQMLPDSARQDLIVAQVALKYTQSNSMCLVVDGQVIGMGAGQQSRIHCTRLAASKADTWFLRQHPDVLDLRFRDGLGRPERDNAIDGFLRDDLSAAEEEVWKAAFEVIPKRLSPVTKMDWLNRAKDVAMGSDAFIPFRDNIDRAAMSGVGYVIQPGGSLRDNDVVDACDQYDMVMVFSGVRLFHH